LVSKRNNKRITRKPARKKSYIPAGYTA